MIRNGERHMMKKKDKQRERNRHTSMYGMYRYCVFILLILMSALLYTCTAPKSTDSTDYDIKFYVSSVEKSNVVTNSVILQATNFSTKSDIPKVTWENKLSDPSKWLVLMYKRGSSDIFFSSIVDGDSTTKEAGVADYVNTSNFSTHQDFPVEYRVSVTRLEAGTWSIDSASGNITVSGGKLTQELTLEKKAQIDIARYGEEEYTTRIEGKNAFKNRDSDAQKIIDASLSGNTAGIPLIKTPSAFELTSTSMSNGEVIGILPDEKGFKHSSGNCSGYLGESVSPALDWSKKTAKSNNSTFVVLAYDPVQKNPVGKLNETAASPYFSLWFQYNIPVNVKKMPEGDGGNGTSDKKDEDNPLFDSTPTPKAGTLSHNVYSLSSSELLGFYNLTKCYDTAKPDLTTLPIRKRYDGPLSNPYSGRHYTRFLVFEVDNGSLAEFKDASVESLQQNKVESATRRAELKKFGFDKKVSGSSVDMLVQNFIDIDRTKIRNNDFTDLNVNHKNGKVKVLGVSVLLFAIDAATLPF